MRNLLLILLSAILFNCQKATELRPIPAPLVKPEVKPLLPDSTSPTSYKRTTASVVGRYLVTTYIVAGDTLHTASYGFPIKSKLDIDNFAIVIKETGDDQYSLTYSYYHNPTGEVPTFIKKITGSVLNDYFYRFVATDAQQPGMVFDAKQQRVTKQLYLRTVGGGVNIPLAGSSTPLNQMTDKEVIIVAVPQR